MSSIDRDTSNTGVATFEYRGPKGSRQVTIGPLASRVCWPRVFESLLPPTGQIAALCEVRLEPMGVYRLLQRPLDAALQTRSDSAVTKATVCESVLCQSCHNPIQPDLTEASSDMRPHRVSEHAVRAVTGQYDQAMVGRLTQMIDPDRRKWPIHRLWWL